MSYVKRIVRRSESVVELRQKFNAKLGPTQCYQEEKDLVLKAVNDHDFESISAFVRHAVRELLVDLGYEVPPDEDFVKIQEE